MITTPSVNAQANHITPSHTTKANLNHGNPPAVPAVSADTSSSPPSTGPVSSGGGGSGSGSDSEWSAVGVGIGIAVAVALTASMMGLFLLRRK